MKTILDSSVLSAFIKSRPNDLSDEKDQECWNSFKAFIRSRSNLVLHNVEQLDDYERQFLLMLSSGRLETSIKLETKSMAWYKNEIKEESPYTFFGIDSKEETIQKKYLRKNGYLIGFGDTILPTWERFNVLHEPKVRTVRNAQGSNIMFTSWELLANYLTPFTDAVIVDNYLFNDHTLIPSNLVQILLQLDKATPVPFNLTFISYEGNRRELKAGPTYALLKELKIKHNLKCKIDLALTNRSMKEHDRGIFTNYLRIRSGDSFNYFNSSGGIITHGTEISFASMADFNERQAAIHALDVLAETVNKIRTKNPMNYRGECNNRLLSMNE